MKKLHIILLVHVILCSATGFSQDYFEDLKGNGNPIGLNITKDFNISARLNAGDNSAKLNLFKVYRLGLRKKNGTGYEKGDINIVKPGTTFAKVASLINRPSKFTPEDFTPSALFGAGTSSFKLNDLGFGLSAKGKTSDGLGNLFSKGRVSPETQFGAYMVYKNVKIKADEHKYTFVVSPFLNVNVASYQFIKTDTTYKYQTSDTTLNAINYGLSAFIKFYRNKEDQFIIGASVTQSRLNNYKDLDQVEVKETVTKQDTSGNVRTITTVNDNGYTFASGVLKQYWNTNLKCHITCIPYQLDYRVALVAYPSVDINNIYSDPLYNIGFGVHFLEKNNPTISIAGIFFEFNDCSNSKNSSLPFMKRSFKVGVTAALNVTTLIKK